MEAVRGALGAAVGGGIFWRPGWQPAGGGHEGEVAEELPAVHWPLIPPAAPVGQASSRGQTALISLC